MDVKAKLAAQRERLEVLRQRSERLGRDLPEGSIREEFMRGVEETRREVEQAIADTERTIFKLEVENDLEGLPLAFEPWWRRVWSRLRAPIG